MAPSRLLVNAFSAFAFSMITTLIIAVLIKTVAPEFLTPVYAGAEYEQFELFKKFLLKVFCYYFCLALVWQFATKDGLWNFSSKIFLFFTVAALLFVGWIVYSLMLQSGDGGLVVLVTYFVLIPAVVAGNFVPYAVIKAFRFVRQSLKDRAGSGRPKS